MKHFPQRIERNGSTRAWRSTRTRILARDHHRCRQCGKPAQNVDRIRSVASGGTDHAANLQALCATCNLSKG